MNIADIKHGKPTDNLKTHLQQSIPTKLAEYKEVKHTRIFDTLKARITVPQAAAYYGVRIGQNGMCRCPFHPDKTPSMKINETYYYCFGCHTTGDVIDFTARLFNLSPLDAARKLALDFGIDPNTPASAAVAPPRIQQEESQREREGHCASVLIEYERLLKSRQQRFAPRSSLGGMGRPPRICKPCAAAGVLYDRLSVRCRQRYPQRYRQLSARRRHHTQHRALECSSQRGGGCA